jgi:hypothetical protein
MEDQLFRPTGIEEVIVAPVSILVGSQSVWITDSAVGKCVGGTANPSFKQAQTMVEGESEYSAVLAFTGDRPGVPGTGAFLQCGALQNLHDQR